MNFRTFLITAAVNGALRILFADDHEIFRAGLRQVLAGDRDIEIIAELLSASRYRTYQRFFGFRLQTQAC